MAFYAEKIIDEYDRNFTINVLSGIIRSMVHENISDFDSNDMLIASKRFKTNIKNIMEIIGEDVEVLEDNHIKKVKLYDVIYSDLWGTIQNIIALVMQESIDEYHLEKMVNECLE